MAKTIRRPLFDLSQIQDFRDVFPELTTIEQFETGMLFSLGLSKKEIAAARNVAYRTVEHSLEDIKARYDLYSLNDLLSIFQIRLVFFALSECKRHSRSASNGGKGDEGVAHA